MSNTSFTDIPRNTQPSQKVSPVANRTSKSRFRKTAFVTTAVQTKKTTTKTNTMISDNSDSEDSIQSIKKIKKKSKSIKGKLTKAVSEIKGKI